MLAALIIGFCFGFFGSIPVAGPIAALVLKRGLDGRFRSATAIGVGAAFAEAGYAFLAFWGFATYLTRYPIIEPLSRIFAGAILIGLGVTFARYKSAKLGGAAPGADSPGKSLLLGFTITALNPTFLATWAAATTTLYSSDLITLDPSDAIVFSLGALLGIIAWFGLFTGLLKRYAGRFDQDKLARVVRGIGVLILLLGAWFSAKAFLYFTGRA